LEVELGKIAKKVSLAAEALGEQEADCTAVIDLLIRARTTTDASLIIIATDGVDTCRHDLPSIPPPPRGTRIVVVLVGSAERATQNSGKKPRVLNDALQYEARSARLRAVAPWATILLPWQVSAEALLKVQ
jgi:hypothetical protein